METEMEKKLHKQKLDFDLYAKFGNEFLNTNWLFKKLVKLDIGLFSAA